MRKLTVDKPAGGDERDDQRSAEEKSKQTIRDACCFHGSKVGQAFLPVFEFKDSAAPSSSNDRQKCLSYSLFLQAPSVSNKRVDFLFGKFFPEGGHLALAIHD